MIVALAFMTVLTFVQVVLRYGFGTGFVWSLEATTYTFAWLVLIGMSYGVRTEAHIAVDLVTSRLPPRGARAFAGVALVCGARVLRAHDLRQLAVRRAPDDARQQRARHSAAALAAHGHHADRVRLLALRLVQAARPV